MIAGSPTIGPDGTIYVAAHDGGLYAVDAAGKVRWRFAMQDRSWSTPAVAEDGTIYVGSDDDHLYAGGAPGVLFESHDGGTSWELNRAFWEQPMS